MSDPGLGVNPMNDLQACISKLPHTSHFEATCSHYCSQKPLTLIFALKFKVRLLANIIGLAMLNI